VLPKHKVTQCIINVFMHLFIVCLVIHSSKTHISGTDRVLFPNSVSDFQASLYNSRDTFLRLHQTTTVPTLTSCIA